MYAILSQGGHQYRVAPGDRLLVDRLPAEVGTVVALEPVVLVQDDDGIKVGDGVDGARVAATVVAHRRGPKLRVFKYKPKKRYRRTIGHRSDLTELVVEALVGRNDKLPEPKAHLRVAGKSEAEEAEPARGKRDGLKEAKPAKDEGKREAKAKAEPKPEPAEQEAPRSRAKAAPKAEAKPAEPPQEEAEGPSSDNEEGTETAPTPDTDSSATKTDDDEA